MSAKYILEGNTVLCDLQEPDQSHREQAAVPRSEMFESDNIIENKLNGWEALITLTKREKEILKFVLEGKTNREIAKKLYRTERTVEYHRNRMMRKLGTHNIVELVKRAIQLGIA